MALYFLKDRKLEKIEPTSFPELGMKELQDIEPLFYDGLEMLGEDLFLVGSQVQAFEGSRRKPDLIALDRERKVVVIELKRTLGGDESELQAIRYAAICSAFTINDLIEVHESFLASRIPTEKGKAKERIAKFLGIDVESIGNVIIGDYPRIILVSNGFDKEITTTALWLRKFNLDITCIQAVPQRKDKVGIVIEFSKLIPTPATEDYQIKIRQKAMEEERINTDNARLWATTALFNQGVLKSGTILEVVPAYRPQETNSLDSSCFEVECLAVNKYKWVAHPERIGALGKIRDEMYEKYGIYCDTPAKMFRFKGETMSLGEKAFGRS